MSATARPIPDQPTWAPDPAARRSPSRRALPILLVGLLALVFGALAAPAAIAAPLPCTGQAYVTTFQSTALPPQTLFQTVEQLASGDYTLTERGAYVGENINAIGFRPHDGYIYAWNNGLDSASPEGVTQIGIDAAGNPTFTSLGMPVGAPAGFVTVVGTILDDGTYFLWGTAPSLGWVGLIIDVTTPVPTVIRPVAPAFDPAVMNFSDFAVSPIDGNLYAQVHDAAVAGLGVHRLDFTGTTIAIGPQVADGNGGAGAQWFAPDGSFFTFNNAGGGGTTMGIYRSDFATGQTTFVGSAPSTTTMDGTACANTISMTKDAEPRTVTAGTELTYSYTLTSRALLNSPVTFEDLLPAGMTYVPGSVTFDPAGFGSSNDYGGTDRLTINGSLAPHSSVSITARARVAPDHPCNAAVDNQAQGTIAVPGLPAVTIDSDDPDTPADPDDPTTVQVDCSADLGIVKAAATSPLVPGEDATFTMVATNDGPSTARNVRVSDQLPAEFAFASASQGCAEAAGTLTCTVGALAPGASQTFTVTGRVAADLRKCLENTATVSSDTPDPVVGNNMSTVCVPIRGRSDLSISKTASTATVAPGGGQVMYTLVVGNDGPSDDPGVEVIDALPAGLTLVAAEPSQGSCATVDNTVDCELGRLEEGGSAQVLVTVNTTAASGCIPNVARVRGAHEDPDAADNQASAQVCVEPPPTPPTTFDLEVDKRASATRARIGQKLTYRIVVSNNGPEAAPEARVTDTYNSSARLVSVRASQGSCVRRIPISCELGRIEAGASVTITVVLRPLETGRARNAASATSCCGTDRDPGNNMDTVDVSVRKVALKVTKQASRDSVRAGDRFGYTIRVRNTGKGQARNVKTCDRLPSGLVYVSSSPRAKLSRGQHCWTAKLLKAGQTKVYRVTVRAVRGTSGRKANTVTATSPDARTARARKTVRVIGGAVRGGGVTG